MRIFIFTVVAILAFSTVFAAVPRELNYQGVLTDVDGGVVPDGTYTLTFRLYDVETGGTALWEETRDVEVVKGVFSVTLGSVAPLDLAFDKKYYLGISVGGAEELVPRMPLAAAAYSLTADGVVGTSNIFPSSGNVGIGVSSPVEKLDVAGGVRLANTTNTNPGTIRWTGVDFEGYDGSAWRSLTNQGGQTLPDGTVGMTVRHNVSSWVADSNLYNDGTRVGIGTTDPQARLHVEGDLRVGSSSSDGTIEVFSAGSGDSSVRIGTCTDGGSFSTFNGIGVETCFFGIRGTEGYKGEIKVSGSTGSFQLTTSGSSGMPTFSLSSTVNSVDFDLGEYGDDIVQLPYNSISSMEILDESGVASDIDSFAVQLSSTSYTTVVSRSLTAPSTGYIFAVASGFIVVEHYQGTLSSAVFGLSDESSGIVSHRRIEFELPSALPDGTYRFPVSITHIFPAAEGNNEVFFLGRQDPSSNTIYCDNSSLVLLYLPTSYGSVSYRQSSGGVSGLGGDVAGE